MNATKAALHEYRIMDLRRRHTDAIAPALFDEIRHLLPREIEIVVSNALRAAIYRNGTMLINDAEAARLGLGVKDREGWTASDRVAHLHLIEQAAATAALPIMMRAEKREDCGCGFHPDCPACFPK